MPEVIVKAIVRCHLQDVLYLSIDIPHKFHPVIGALLITSKQFSKLIQYPLSVQISIH